MAENKDKPKYEPEYSDGEIIVLFKGNYSKQFYQDFGSGLGVSYINPPTSSNYPFVIYATKPGCEQKAIEEFSKYPVFVDYAEKRDIKLDKRQRQLEQIISNTRELLDECGELSDSEYNLRLKQLLD